AARQALFRRTAPTPGRVGGPVAPDAGVQSGADRQSATHEQASDRDSSPAAATGGEGEGTGGDCRGGNGYGAELGVGNRRSAAVCFDAAGAELLRTNQRAAGVGRQATAGPDLQTTQRTFAKRTDRSGQTGAAVQPNPESRACQGAGARRECKHRD